MGESPNLSGRLASADPAAAHDRGVIPALANVDGRANGSVDAGAGERRQSGAPAALDLGAMQALAPGFVPNEPESGRQAGVKREAGTESAAAPQNQAQTNGERAKLVVGAGGGASVFALDNLVQTTAGPEGTGMRARPSGAEGMPGFDPSRPVPEPASPLALRGSSPSTELDATGRAGDSPSPLSRPQAGASAPGVVVSGAALPTAVATSDRMVTGMAQVGRPDAGLEKTPETGRGGDIPSAIRPPQIDPGASFSDKMVPAGGAMPGPAAPDEVAPPAGTGAAKTIPVRLPTTPPGVAGQTAGPGPGETNTAPPFAVLAEVEGEADQIRPESALSEPRSTASAPNPAGAPGVTRPDMARSVAVQIAEVVSTAHDRSIELKLHPEELGRVSMTLSNDSGGLTVTVNADRAETLDLMRRNIDLLGQELRRLGYGSVDFSFGDGRSGTGGAQTSDNARTAPAESGEPGAVDDPTDAALRPARARSGHKAGGIDIRL